MALIISKSRYLKISSECSFCQKNNSYFHILCTALNKNNQDLDNNKNISDSKIICSDPNEQSSDLKTQNSSAESISPDKMALSLSPKTICSDLKTRKTDSKLVSSKTKPNKSILSIPISDIAAACLYHISSVYSKNENSDPKKSSLCKRNLSLGSTLKKSTSDSKISIEKPEAYSALITSAMCSNSKNKTSKPNRKKECPNLQNSKAVTVSKSSPNLQATKSTSKKTSSEPKNAYTALKALCFSMKKTVSNKKSKNTALKKVNASPMKTDQKVVKMPSIKIDKVVHPSTPTLRFIQFLRKNDNRRRLGVVSEDGTSLLEVSGSSCVSTNMCCFLRQNISMFEMKNKLQQLKKEMVSDDHTLLPPLPNPGKIICIDVNKDKEPVFCCKLSSSLIGARDNIFAHKSVKELDCDVELAVILGKRGKCVPQKDAMDYVFGYSIVQDITARDWQNGSQFVVCKSMDTFCPLGPAIVHKSLIKDPYDLNMRTFVNGVEKHAASTKNMSLKIEEIICRVSQNITIEPGDIIVTNTPKGTSGKQNKTQYLKPGDCVQSEISCLGRLLNKVVSG